MEIDKPCLDELKSLLLEIRETVNKLSRSTENDLMTPAEVCRMLKISRNTYQRYVTQKIFTQKNPSGKKNGKTYVSRAEIDRLIEEGRL